MQADTLLKGIQKALMSFEKRAERVSNEILEATFVDAGPILELVSNTNNQIIYGRRGTGKTHVFKYLENKTRKNDELSIYIDLRNIGSNGSIYGDSARGLPERATSLVTDVYRVLLGDLYEAAIARIDGALHPEQITLRLDDLDVEINRVRFVGESSAATETESELNSTAGVSASVSDGFDFTAKSDGSVRERSLQRKSRTGTEHLHLHFGGISTALRGLLSVLGISRMWILIDEWSEIPIAIQPYLADMIRKTLLTINNVTVKIAAIEHRTDFSILLDRGEYIGLELGADISADLNLDDFLVFDNSEGKAIEFFKNLIFNHYRQSDLAPSQVDTPDRLIQHSFTQSQVFIEFVKAVEGVPRDALNLMTKAATKAYGRQIAMNDVKKGAKDWYQQDKYHAISSSPHLGDLLSHIISTVIGERKARAFLLESNVKSPDIDRLFDARILHIRKKNISSNDEPGKRYNSYKIDYGCYVDLIGTAKNPTGYLWEADSEEYYPDVPSDDYRSIRRAILNPAQLRSP